jgi:flagellar biosynthesis/type III secretory pathway protein FliH
MPEQIATILERTNPMTTSLYEIYEDAVKDRYLEQGLQQGREKGLEQGLEQGREALLTVVRSLHGQPSEGLTTAVKGSTLPLDELAQLVLKAKDSTELERLLRR